MLARQLNMKSGTVLLQYEGLNPSGSFKDNGMSAAFTHARMVGAKKLRAHRRAIRVLRWAMFASLAEMQEWFSSAPGKFPWGKLSQALDYGAKTLQIKGDFDACLRRIRQIATDPKMGHLPDELGKPVRLEGQKIDHVFESLRRYDWQPPDWVIVPGETLAIALPSARHSWR